MGLLTIPGTAAGAAQARDNGYQSIEALCILFFIQSITSSLSE
jgi:hypothetical protein